MFGSERRFRAPTPAPTQPRGAAERLWTYIKRTGAMPPRRTPLKDRLLVTGLCTFCVFILASLAIYAGGFIALFIKALL